MSHQSLRFEQFFAAPRGVVFEWFSQHENIGRLFPLRVRRVLDSPSSADVNGLGSVRELRLLLLRVEETITGFQRPESIEYRVTRGWPISSHVGRLRFEEVPGGTRLEYTIEFDSRMVLLGGVIAGFLCASWRRGAQRAVDAISAVSTPPLTHIDPEHP
ncbi:MAG: SRPBCC family protein [Panacagrimonas sp.]